MKRSVRRTLLALLLVLIYLLWHPDPTRRELVIETTWALDTRTVSVDASADGGESGLIPVAGTDAFAYVRDNGAVAYRGRIAHRIALSGDAFINYGRLPGQLVVQSADGAFIASLPRAGYPLFLAERLFVVSDGGGALSEWTREGVLRWQAELAAPLTAVTASVRLLAVGLAAGGPLVLDADGAPVELQRSPGPVEPVVYAVALAEEPPRFAVITATTAGDGAGTRAAPGAVPGAVPGARTIPATITLYELGSGRGVPVLRRSIARAESTPVVRLVDDGQTLLYTTVSDGPLLVLFGIDSGDDASVPLRLPAADVRDIGAYGLKAALTVGEDRDPARGFARPSELVLLSSDGVVPVRVGWAGDAAAIDSHDGLLTLRVDDRVLAVRLGVE